jgi:drug/metabolite transporter (DMT)-like permease
MERTSPINTLDTRTQGWINGFIGVVIFSGSLPATRLAVMEFDPAFLTMIRAAIAAALGVLLLWLFKEKRPARNQWGPLVVVALGVVIGFPLLTALALQYVTSAHSIVFIGLLPLATAVFGVLRGGERPRPVFWMFSILGSVCVMGYAFAQGLSAAPAGDLLMLLAVLACGLGYAEGELVGRQRMKLLEVQVQHGLGQLVDRLGHLLFSRGRRCGDITRKQAQKADQYFDVWHGCFLIVVEVADNT